MILSILLLDTNSITEMIADNKINPNIGRFRVKIDMKNVRIKKVSVPSQVLLE